MAFRKVNRYGALERIRGHHTFLITGLLCLFAGVFDKLANHNSLTYEIAPTLTWNFFQGTQKIQATRLAKAQLDESIRQFNQTVLTSVQEVDNAMSSYKNSIKQIVALREW